MSDRDSENIRTIIVNQRLIMLAMAHFMKGRSAPAPANKLEERVAELEKALDWIIPPADRDPQ